MGKSLDYNTDPVKHYVRYNGWINTFRTIKNHSDNEFNRKRRPNRCKYFTFCALEAVDVFMFEKINFIYRDPSTKRLSNVFFCENDVESFSVISKMIGSEQQGFFGDFKDIILQDITQPDLGQSDDPFDEPETSADREILRLKEVKRSLVKVFPFDVINLDLYGNFFPKFQSRYSDACQTYSQVLELQKLNNEYDCKRFAMFLTVYTPVNLDQINPDAFETLEQTIFSNFTYEAFRNTFLAKFGHNNPHKIEVYLRFIIGFVKRIIFIESYRQGWQPIVKEILCYDRQKPQTGEPYKMTTFVIEYRRNPGLEQLDFAGTIPQLVKDDYLAQLCDLLLNQPAMVPDEAQVPQEIIEDLDGIIRFRNTFLSSIGL